MWEQLKTGLINGDIKSLARAISLVENQAEGADLFMQSLPVINVPVIGITGPPGAGKSTLTDTLIGKMTEVGKKTAVLCVDPSSPFNLGAVLGDRIRMSNWYNHPDVYIRSLATRGALGGLHPYIMEITDICKAAGFDYVIVETVGVGQSEVEITGLADATVVVLVPEAGDEVQTMKAGLMEIADLFVLNKADRPDADQFARHLRLMLAPAFKAGAREIPIIKTVATEKDGIDELWTAINHFLSSGTYNEQKPWLLAEKVYRLIQQNRMKDVNKKLLLEEIKKEMNSSLNIYRFAASFRPS
jgi:LAO/AO transport system kinase